MVVHLVDQPLGAVPRQTDADRSCGADHHPHKATPWTGVGGAEFERHLVLVTEVDALG